MTTIAWRIGHLAGLAVRVRRTALRLGHLTATDLDYPVAAEDSPGFRAEHFSA